MVPKSIFVRLWLLALVGFWIVGVIVGYMGYESAKQSLSQDSYYVVVHFYDLTAHSVAMIVFAIVYWGLSRSKRVDINPKLAWGHFLSFVLGSAMVFGPSFYLLAGNIPKRYADYPSTCEKWNHIATVGAWLVVGSFVLFAGVILIFLLKRRKNCA